MANARSVIPEETVYTFDNAATPPAVTDLQQEALDSWGNFAEDSRLKFGVYEVAANGKQPLCFNFQPSDYPDPSDVMSETQEKFGPGEYRIRGYANGKQCLNHAFSVKKPRDNSLIHRENFQPAQQSNDLFLMMMQQQQQSSRDMMQMMQHSSGQLMQLMGVLLPAMLGNQQQGPDIIGLMGIMKDTFKAPDDPLVSVKNALELINMTGGGNNQGEVVDPLTMINNTIKTFGPPLVKMVTATQENNQAREAAAIAQAREATRIHAQHREQNPAALPTPQQPQQLQQTKEATPVDKLNEGVNKLVAMAEAGLSAATGASAVLDLITDEELEQFGPALYSPELITELAVYHAGVAKHLQWFEDMRQAICFELDETGEGEGLHDNTVDVQLPESDPGAGDESDKF